MANNSIALLAQAPVLDTPLESQAKAMQIRSMMNQGAVQDMDMQARRQSMADDAGIRAIYAQVEDPAERIKAAYKVNPKAAQALEKAQIDMGKDRAATGETEAKTRNENLKAINMRMQQARDLLGNINDKQGAATWVQGLYADPDVGKFLTQQIGPVEQALSRIPDPQTDPQGFNKWRMASQLGAEKLVAETKPQVGVRNLGNRSQTTLTDQNTGKVIVTDSQAIGQSPDSVASNATQRRGQNMQDARAKQALAAASSGDSLLPQETVSMMAQQYLAGDTSVMQNLGRGAQGAQNIIKLRNEIARQTTEQGKGGADLAAQNAEYFGTKAGQRSAGTRIANVEMAAYEAKNLMPMARDASAAVARSGLLPFGKGQVIFNEQTNDPAMRQFAAANNALVNVYSRAISPSGVPTVADKEHAREMISTAMSHEAYLAVVDQMERELTAAQAAPQQVRQAFNDAVTKRGSHSAPAAPKGGPAVGAVEGGYKFKGGNPADKANWVKQ